MQKQETRDEYKARIQREFNAREKPAFEKRLFDLLAARKPV